MTAVSVAESHPERVIVNPVSGERIVIRTRGAETDGRLLVFDLFLPPGARVPAQHAHPIQTERFTMQAGRMRFVLGWRSILAVPGDTVLVPPGTAHWFENAGSDTVCVRVEVRPALRTEELLEASAALATTGRFFGTRLPPLSDLAGLLHEFQREVAVPHVPPPLAGLVIAALAWIGRRRANHGVT